MVPPVTPRRGYTQLANFMVGREHVMLRQYKELAVRDLLYLQAELCDLQYDYARQAQIDAQQQDDRQKYDREWWYLQSDEARGGDGRQWQLALQIRSKLKEYYAALQQYESTAGMRRPSRQQREMVHSFIRSESLGGNCQFLGRDLADEPLFPSVFDASNRDDLIFLGEDNGDDDLFSRFTSGPGMRAMHRIWRSFKKPANMDEEMAAGCENSTYLYQYSSQKLQTALDVLGAAVSSLVPMVSIIILFFVHDLLARLGLVCLFTFLFSICLSVATKARRIEVFGATAAFASVQVVFVGTTNLA